MLSNEELLKHATQFDFEYVNEKILSIRFRDANSWCVSLRGDCYDKKLKMFVWEPSPSNITDEFLRATRFSLEDAIEIIQGQLQLCDDGCRFLSITEEEQNKLKPKPNHICLKYNTRVKHVIYHPRLMRCRECLMDV